MKKTIKYQDDLDKSPVNPEPPHLERRSTTALEKAQAQQRHLTHERLAAVSRVSAAIAQQFNDPLQAITNVLGGIHRRGCLEPEDMPMVDLAYQEVKKMNRLSRQLREFYQPTLGKTDLFHIQVELERIIDENRQKLLDKGIIFTTDFAENIPPIQAVASQIRKVFQELLDNAILACDKDDTINISTSMHQDIIVVRIEDSGCGIDPAIISQLFEPFNRAQSKKSTRDLNLAISYAVITLHGGTIEAEVKENKVTTIRVMLPVKPDARGYDTSSHQRDKT